MSKEVKTYLFAINSNKYYLETERSAGFMEPYRQYQLVDKNNIPKEAIIITVRSALHPGYKAFLSNRQKEMDKSYSGAAYEMDEPDSEMGTSFDSEDSDSELLGSE